MSYIYNTPLNVDNLSSCFTLANIKNDNHLCSISNFELLEIQLISFINDFK